MDNNNNETINVSKKDKGLILAICVILLIVSILAVVGFLFIGERDQTVQGQCEATEIRISGKMPGRIAEIYVEEGAAVKAGDTLVRIHSSIMEAKLDQATAMQHAAAATNRKANAGTRSQLISGAYDIWQQAIAQKTITQKTFERVQRLFDQGVVSEQKRDEAKAAHDAAIAGEQAARSQYELAREGAQAEDRQAASAMVDAARGSVKEVDAVMEDQYLLAPCDGTIVEIYPNASELVGTGTPIMSLQTDERWSVFSVRETMLKNIKEGTLLKVYIPALDINTEMKVFYIKDMGSYANWQATKATGDFDSRTFKIKARPTKKIDGFRPGMSVILLNE